MSARTCLLCGKALSRIWAGSGDDFCSREHRNQYRLRQGMDRLLETTRVSNVMRRRELPMPVALPLISKTGGARPADSREIRISAQSRPALPPPRKAQLAIQAPPAGEPRAEVRIAGAPAQPREFQLLRQRQRQALPLSRRAKMASAGSGAIAQPERSAGPAHPPRKGRALRVSLSAGFRLPPAPKHQFWSRIGAPPKLRGDQPIPMPPVLKERDAESHQFGAVAIIPQVPPQRIPNNAPRISFVWPEIRMSGMQPRPAPAAPRETAAAFGRSELAPCEVSLRAGIRAVALAAGFVRAPGRPSNFAAARKTLAVPFATQDPSATLTSQEHLLP